MYVVYFLIELRNFGVLADELVVYLLMLLFTLVELAS